MPKRVNLYVGEPLYARARAELGDDYSWSAGFRRFLEQEIQDRARPGCAHDVVTCGDCGSRLDVVETGAGGAPT